MSTPQAVAAGDPPGRLDEKTVVGLKYFDQLMPLLNRLHDDHNDRDKAGNRQLHFDQYAALVLLYLFNPICTSLRAVQQASELKNVQSRLGCQRASLGSLSEASSLFDPGRLIEIVQELGSQVQTRPRDSRLSGLSSPLTLVDGTLISAMPRIMAASVMKAQTGSGMVKWRLHTHFEVDRYVPARIDVTVDGGGESDERAVMSKTIERDRCYVMDRGYAKFALFNEIVAKQSSYVCRLRDNSTYEILEERPLSEADRAADVLSDQMIKMGTFSDHARNPNHPLRLVVVKVKPHHSRGKYKGGSTGVDSDGHLRIATNLVDVPAEIISLIYSYRWTIETFFYQFKHLLGCRHLISHNQNGIEIQAYCAIIACLLISLWTGRKPTKRTQEMLCFLMMGWATEEEVAAHIEKLKQHDLEAQKQD